MSIVDTLRENLEDAVEIRSDIEKYQEELGEATDRLDDYIEKVEALIESLSDLPEVAVYVPAKTIRFEA